MRATGPHRCATASPTVGGEPDRSRDDAYRADRLYAGGVKAVMAYMNRRFAMLPFGYAPAILLVSDVAVLVVTTGAVVQRDGFVPPGWALVGGLIAASHVLWLIAGLPLPPASRLPYWMAFSGFVGTGVLLMDAKVQADLAPIVIVLMAGEVAAIASIRLSLPISAVGAVLLAAMGLADRVDDAPLYIVIVALGWMVGFIVQTQLRMLERERNAQAGRAEQAVGDERRRIAREVHDVVAHSLSITLLHVTGARRALQEDRDVDDAIEALGDAERIGRQAMADIRRTVGLLDSGPSKTAPEPDLDDIDDLVADFRRAGVPVTYEMCGEADAVSPATGLGLYRIMQESLANVAKHAPGTAADASLRIDTGSIALSVRNDTPRGTATAADRNGGSGLNGMRQRIELLGGRLRAGPDTAGWSVHAEIPVDADARNCFLNRIQGLS